MSKSHFENLNAAITYAESGLPVIPLHGVENGQCTCRIACKSPGKHPRIKDWIEKASIDEQVIKAWWSQFPNSNVGIITGRASNLFVLDVDTKHGGQESLKALEEEFEPLPTTLKSHTGGGGQHYYFDLPPNSLKNRVSFRPGLDIRGEGGFIVAAPAAHASGTNYRWDRSFRLDHVARAPDWLVQEIIKPSPLQLGKIVEGQRNSFLASQAGSLVKRGITGLELFKALSAINTKRVSPPLDEAEVKRIASNISRYDSGIIVPKILLPEPADEWPKEPKVLPSVKCSSPEFKTSMIPQVLRDWVIDITDRMQVVPEFVMVPVIVAMATVVGRQLRIYPKKHDDWVVVANLWGAIVARPGSLKSPTIAEAFAPFEAIIKKAAAKYAEEKAEIAVDAESLTFELEVKKEQLIKALKAKDEAKINAIKLEMVKLQEHVNDGTIKERRYKTNDATVEKISQLLRDNPNGLMLFRDELAGWMRSLDKTGREGDREFFLEAWNGYGSYTVDRVGNGTIHVPALCMSIFGGIQPSKLNDYIKRCSSGVGDDGLLQRFQLLVYPEESKTWRNIDRAPNKEAKEQVTSLFSWLDDVRWLGTGDEDEIAGVRFSDAAQDRFNDWRTNLELRLRSNEIDNPSFESHLAKYRSLIPSLALIFWLCEVFAGGDETAVSDSALKMAIEWADFLELHARKVYFSEIQFDSVSATSLAEKIKAGKVHDNMTLRAICRYHWANLGTKEQVEDAIEVLEQLGWVKSSFGLNKGPSSKRIRLHPEFCKQNA